MELEAPVEPWSEKVGMAAGVLLSVAVFLWVFFAAISSVGWVIGIVFGWIPAALAAALAFFIGRHLWWFLAILIVLAVVLILRV